MRIILTILLLVPVFTGFSDPKIFTPCTQINAMAGSPIETNSSVVVGCSDGSIYRYFANNLTNILLASHLSPIVGVVWPLSNTIGPITVDATTAKIWSNDLHSYSNVSLVAGAKAKAVRASNNGTATFLAISFVVQNFIREFLVIENAGVYSLQQVRQFVALSNFKDFTYTPGYSYLVQINVLGLISFQNLKTNEFKGYNLGGTFLGFVGPQKNIGQNKVIVSAILFVYIIDPNGYYTSYSMFFVNIARYCTAQKFAYDFGSNIVLKDQTKNQDESLSQFTPLGITIADIFCDSKTIYAYGGGSVAISQNSEFEIQLWLIIVAVAVALVAVVLLVVCIVQRKKIKKCLNIGGGVAVNEGYVAAQDGQPSRGAAVRNPFDTRNAVPANVPNYNPPVYNAGNYNAGNYNAENYNPPPAYNQGQQGANLYPSLDNLAPGNSNRGMGNRNPYARQN